jgi:hypothetical protein
MSRGSRRNKITVCLYDSEDREVEVVAEYHGATDNYYDRALGVHLPGDPEDIDVLSVRAVDEGADTDEVEARTDAIEEAVREAAADDGPDEDFAYECARDARLERE